MAHSISAELDARQHRFAIVVARFNELITQKLLTAAIESLTRHGASADEITQVWTPGAFEIPLAAQKLASSGRYSAIIGLGCVIRGETPHFDYVAGECSRGIAQVSLDTGVPVIFGVLTTENMQQALDRAGGKAGNKGADAAQAAIEMASLMKRLSK